MDWYMATLRWTLDRGRSNALAGTGRAEALAGPSWTTASG